MRQPGTTTQHNEEGANMSSKELLLHSIKEEEEARSMGKSSCSGALSGAGCAAAHPGVNLRKICTAVSDTSEDGEEEEEESAESSGSSRSSSEAGASPAGEPAGAGVRPMDIGLKVANEIIGLHSQAAAAGRALAHSTRQAELWQEENKALKEDLDKAKQTQRAMEEEVSRLKAKLSQRSIEMLMQEQKVQAAEDQVESQAKATAEQKAARAAAQEQYESLVMRVMVVAVKASVAAEELDRALMAGKGPAGSSCGCKPAIQHGIEVLNSLAAFKDTWLQASNASASTTPDRTPGSKAAAPGSASTASSAGPAKQATFALAPTAAGTTAAAAAGSARAHGSSSSIGRSAALTKERSSSRLDTGRGGGSRSTSSNGTYPSMPCSGPTHSSRPAVARPSSAGEVGRQAKARAGFSALDSRALSRSVEIPRLQLATLQQQLQQLQGQRQARKSSYNPPARPAPRSKSIATSREVSPGRGVNLPSTDALAAAASAMCSSILQQKRQRQLSLRTSPALQGRPSMTDYNRRASNTSAGVPERPVWGSARREQRRLTISSSSAGPSRVASPRRTVQGYESDAAWEGGPSRLAAEFSARRLTIADLQRSYGDGLCEPQCDSPQHSQQAMQPSKSSFMIDSSAYKRLASGRRSSSTNGWY